MINECFMLASASFVAAGWVQIRRGHVHRHRRFMLTAASLGAAFFVSYLLATLTVGDTLYGGPHRYALGYQVFLQVHVILATAAAVLGVITLRLAWRRRYRRHRRVAPWTATLWFISAASGLVVFLLLFVVFPPGPHTTSLIHVLLHG